MSEQLKQVAPSLGLFTAPAAQSKSGVFGQGVTGVDMSIPFFDGTSSDPHDYLIDLETDSMERYPDIRSYLYWVGDLQQDAIDPPPTDLEARKLYDDDLVRRGRLYLKSEKAKGHGLYLSKERDFLALNVPGERWYRMPIAGLVEEFLKGKLKPMEEEGAFNLDPRYLGGPVPMGTVKGRRGWVILTNIRGAIWWEDPLRPGIVPGTRGWDSAVCTLYQWDCHPSSVMWSAMGGRLTITDHLGLPPSHLFQVDKAMAIVDENWYREEDEENGGEGGDSEDEEETAPNRIIFNPAFLAEIAPDKPKRFFDRFK